MRNTLRFWLIFFVTLTFNSFCFALPSPLPSDFLTFSSAYPDVTFEISYDSEYSDWKIDVTVPRPSGEPSKARFYWADGAMLPQTELESREKYWSLLYHYPKTLVDPADLSSEEAAALKNFGSSDNRKNGAGTPMFFFDTLYDSVTRANLEKRIVDDIDKKLAQHKSSPSLICKV